MRTPMDALPKTAKKTRVKPLPLFPIDSEVPVPEHTDMTRPRALITLRLLKVGESFAVPLTGKELEPLCLAVSERTFLTWVDPINRDYTRVWRMF